MNKVYKDKKKRLKIDPKMPISALLALYPELAEILTYEYGLYCVNCVIADFDTLEGGAEIHGITDVYLGEMIEHLEKTINENQDVQETKAT